ncbi:AraC family transcriptional regulator [Shimia sp. MIT1388]|uniref:AraC family transcriptional regulator n=1 Tax=Shimia sp. MIT1388 TaxID=3096992 RepID=UPI00399A3999
MGAFDSSSIVFNVSPADLDVWPYAVPVAGRTVARGADGMVRQNYHQHVLILTLGGTGVIEVGGAAYEARAGDLAWIDTALTYAHGAEAEEKWSYLWMAVSGHGLDAVRLQLGFDAAPIESGCQELTGAFDAALATLFRANANTPGALSALVGNVLGKVSSLRSVNPVARDSSVVSKVAEQVRKELDRAWTIADMVSLSGLSQSQLFRRFKAETGNSPMGWLRKERIVLASYVLRTTEKPIAQVALQCGYQDPFHFSRDFKRMQGLSPRTYRVQAQGEE